MFIFSLFEWRNSYLIWQSGWKPLSGLFWNRQVLKNVSSCIFFLHQHVPFITAFSILFHRVILLPKHGSALHSFLLDNHLSCFELYSLCVNLQPKTKFPLFVFIFWKVDKKLKFPWQFKFHFLLLSLHKIWWRYSSQSTDFWTFQNSGTEFYFIVGALPRVLFWHVSEQQNQEKKVFEAPRWFTAGFNYF